MRLILCFVGWVFFATGAIAQDLSVCKAFVSNTLVSRSNSSLIAELANADHQAVCKLDQRSYERAQSRKERGGLSYGPFSAGGGASASKDQFEQSVEQMCSESSAQFVARMTSQSQATDSSGLVSVVNNCLELAAQSKVELISGTITQSTSLKHLVTLRNSAHSDTVRKYSIRKILPTETFDCGNYNDDNLLGAVISFECSVREEFVDDEPIMEITLIEVDNNRNPIDGGQTRTIKGQFTNADLQSQRFERMKALYDREIDELQMRFDRANKKLEAQLEEILTRVEQPERLEYRRFRVTASQNNCEARPGGVTFLCTFRLPDLGSRQVLGVSLGRMSGKSPGSAETIVTLAAVDDEAVKVFVSRPFQNPWNDPGYQHMFDLNIFTAPK